MTTTISPDGALHLPDVFRLQDNLRPGQKVEIERTSKGEYVMHVISDADEKGESWVDWLVACPVKDWFVESRHAGSAPNLVEVLLSCPVKDFFVPMERGETTADFKPLSFE